MGRKKPADPMIRVTFHMKKSHVENLKNICYEMSFKEKKDYNISYLIRETLLQAYPISKDTQTDMFGGK